MMVIIKKIKLDLMEKYLEDIVILCSQIKVSQEELKYVNSRMKNNKNDFSSGDISKSLFTNEKNSLEKEGKKLSNKIKTNIKESLKRLESLRKILNAIEI